MIALHSPEGVLETGPPCSKRSSLSTDPGLPSPFTSATATANDEVPAPGLLIPALGIKVAVGVDPGAVITDEDPNGIAALAGVHAGDIINAVDDGRVKSPIELQAELSNRGGTKVRLHYLIRGLWQTETVIVLP
jgi:S1-C subfamily serine protease